MDERTLVLAARHGDRDSFNLIVLTWQDILFNTARRILGDDELVADATQEAFISAFRSINSFRGGSLKAWLMRIVTNVCYDELRRKKRRRTVPLEPISNEYDDMEISYWWLADTNLLPEEKLENIEFEHAIRYCLQTLPINFRTVLVLDDIQGMNYHEAARANRHHQELPGARVAVLTIPLAGVSRFFTSQIPVRKARPPLTLLLPGML